MKKRIIFLFILFISFLTVFGIVKYVNNAKYNETEDLKYQFPEPFPLTYNSYNTKTGPIQLNYNRDIPIKVMNTCEYTETINPDSGDINIDKYRIFSIGDIISGELISKCYGPIENYTILNDSLDIIQNDYSEFSAEIAVPIEYENLLTKNTNVQAAFENNYFESYISDIDVKYQIIDNKNYINVGVIIKNNLNLLKENAIMNVQLNLATRENVILIPINYLYTDNKGRYYVYTQDDIKYVQIGIESDGFVEITQGLTVNELIYQKE